MSGNRTVGACLRRFGKDDEGSLVIFSLFIFLTMLVFGGVAVDLMLYENKRTHVQNSTDRAVLAAANLNQTIEPKTVVKDYLAKVGIAVEDDDIDVVEVGDQAIITGRQVSVSVDAEHKTLLMKLVGMETLPYRGASEAEESVNDIEVSLVLDVSGSMYGTKLSRMQTAAKDFVDGILQGADDDRVSVSLVPYSTQVSAGPDLLAQLVTEHGHTASHCVNFVPDDFETTAIQRSAPVLDENGVPVLDGQGNPQIEIVPLSQTADFDPWKSYRYNRSHSYKVCRNASYLDIQPWSNTAQDLKNQIDDLTANGNTSIDVAVKWGAALLDPSMRPVLNALQDDPDYVIDPEFAPRPHDYGYPDVQKVLVVMTDGINTTQYALEEAAKEGMSDVFWHNNDHWLEVGNSFWNMDDRCWAGGGCGSAPDESKRLTNIEMWSQMSMQWRAYNGWYRRTWKAADFYDQLYDPRAEIGPATKDSQLDTICDAAKANGVLIFTIGFEVTDHSANVMEACASSENYFYRVEGLDIYDAFASIKNQINQLKLTE